jgi:hypothetical protein
MTKQEFWKMIGYVFENYNITCANCPACGDKVYDCADGLMMLHKKLESEERQKMDIGLTAAKEKVRTEFP